MMRILITIFAFAILLQAVDVQVKIEPYKSNEMNIEAFKQFLIDKMHFHPDNQKDLDKRLNEDWLLANYFVKKYNSPFEEADVTNMVNRYLADKAVEKIQRSVKISDDVLRSYYLDHKNKYRMKAIVTFDLYTFKSLQKADAFYRFAKEHNASEVAAYTKKERIKTSSYKSRLNMMLPVFRLVMIDLEQSGYYTPPVYYNHDFDVLYIKNIEKKDEYVPYRVAKKEIAKKLYKQTFLKKRKEILETFMDEQ